MLSLWWHLPLYLMCLNIGLKGRRVQKREVSSGSMVMGGGCRWCGLYLKATPANPRCGAARWVGTMAGTPPADSRDGSPPCPVGGAHSHTCPAQEVKYNISSETHQQTNKWGYRHCGLSGIQNFFIEPYHRPKPSQFM